MKNRSTFLLAVLSIPFWSGLLWSQNAADIGSYAASLFFGRTIINNLDDFSENGLVNPSLVGVGFQLEDHEVDGEAGRPVRSAYEGNELTLGYFTTTGSFNFGVALGLTDLQLESLPDAGNNNFFVNEIQGDGFNIAFSGKKDWERWSAIALLGLGEQSMNGIRRFTEDSPNSPLPKTSAFDVTSSFIRISIQYLLADSSQWKIPAFVSLGYDLLEADGFDEVDVTGNAGDDVDLDSFEDEIPFAELGITFIYQGMEKMTPALRLAIIQDLGDDNVELSWSNGPFSVVSEVNDPTQTSFYGEFSLSFELADFWTLTPEVDYISSDSYSGVSGNMFLNYQF